MSGGTCSAMRCRRTSVGVGPLRAMRRCTGSWRDRGSIMDLVAAVAEQRELAAQLFDQLRRDGLDEPGVSRDPYGAGEQRAHATVTRAAEQLGLRIEHDA